MKNINLEKDFVSTFNQKTKDYIDLLTKLGKKFPILKKMMSMYTILES